MPLGKCNSGSSSGSSDSSGGIRFVFSFVGVGAETPRGSGTHASNTQTQFPMTI